MFSTKDGRKNRVQKKKTEMVSPGGGLEHHVDVLAELSIGNSASTASWGRRRRRRRRGILSAGREDRSRFFRHFLIFIFVVLIHVLDSFVVSFVARSGLVVVIAAEVAGKIVVAGFGLVVFVVKSIGVMASMDDEVQNLEDGPEET
jgi:hypothetical protein